MEDGERIRPEKSEVERLLCDNTKLLNMTDWEPQYNLEKGLMETIPWFEKSQPLYKSEIYNI